MLKEATIPESDQRRENNFGFLRLLFATLVILSHSPALVDGNSSRELLVRVFGTMSLGEVAVDGFFLISGYLILQSMANSKSSLEYLIKRILRIYPGYLVAFALSLCIGSLCGGAGIRPVQWIFDFGQALLLRTPTLDGAFRGNPSSFVNGSMWTVGHEFGCYLLVIILAELGALRARRIFFPLAFLFLLGDVFQWGARLLPGQVLAFGPGRFSVRFIFIFLVGGIFYLFRDKIAYRGRWAAVAAAALVPLMFSSRLAEPACAIFGGYILFWFAFQIKSRRLSRIGGKIDLSYGVYLYAWPIQSFLIWHDRQISPWLLFAVSALLAGLCAYLSWTIVESPCLKLKGRIARPVPTPAPSVA